ncbi:MAG: NAD(P)H-hydrate dehydratase, partial [Bdellovibrionaceae bacterium]|nr:NAD(P)H-hydrate dehydratase [Pseudobdellovibrionaceae bacterium]
ARAGHALADRILALPEFRDALPELRIGIWCGPGHNGADGRIIAGVLAKKFNVQLLVGAAWSVENFEWIIDACFGIGLNRNIEPDVAKQIRWINRGKAKIISVDIPSGLDANRGTIFGEAIRATYTLTLLPAKPGLFLNEGTACAGKICGVSISLPKNIFNAEADSVFLIGPRAAKKLLRTRRATGNKSSFGHLLVVAGSAGTDGAAILTAEAAARMGCGYVSLCTSSSEIFRSARPDFLRLTPEEFLTSDLKKYSAVVIGPGLGVTEQSQKMLSHLLGSHKKVLVDADALTLLSKTKTPPLPPEWLLTPHAGELARLLDSDARDLEMDRLQAVERATQELNAHILFKGFRTVLGTQGKSWIIGSGNVALAKAGTGDILAGFIGSLMAQGHSTRDAALLGAYLHGRIADDWLRRGHSTRTLMASDLADLIDASLRSLKKTGT